MLTLKATKHDSQPNQPKTQLHTSMAVLVSARLITATTSCYYPDGTLSESLIPCNINAEESHCCRESNLCLSNGYCFSSGLGSVIRRGCTEPSWNTSACGGHVTRESYYPVLTPVAWGFKYEGNLKLDGYAEFAEWTALSDDFLVFRGFEELNVRTLLFMQDRLARKEKELAKIGEGSWWSRKKADKPDHLSLLGEEAREAREKLLDEIIPLLQQYNEYLVTYSQIKTLRPAEKYQIDTIAAWFQNHPDIKIPKEQKSILTKADMIAPFNGPKSPLHTLLETLRPQILRQTPGSRQSGARDEILYTKSRSINNALISFANALFIILGVTSLLGPMWILYFIPDGVKRLAIITGFILLFATLVAIATTANPFEILAATAAYATVLMALGSRR